MILIDRRLIQAFDWGLFGAFLLIPLAGMVVLYSAGFDSDSTASFLPWLSKYVPSPALVRQISFILIGLVVMMMAVALPTVWLQRSAYVLYAIIIIALIAVLLFGRVSNGSRRWLTFGPLNIQPAEAMKLALILTFARYLSRHPPPEGGYKFVSILIPLAIVGVPMLLVMKQPDLGTALMLGGIGMSMLLFVGIRRRVLVSMLVLAVGAAYPLWNMLHDYQQKRVLMLFNPETDAQGSGYHIIQSIIAVGSGGFAGKGFLRGTQSQLEFLPEHSTDFIFSVLAEEWGFIGCVVVILLYALFLYRLLRVAQRSRDLFGTLVAVGVSALIFIHVFVNIGMVIGLLPVVGIPLVLFSYGGSSLISTMFSIGVVLGISMRRFAYGKW